MLLWHVSGIVARHLRRRPHRGLAAASGCTDSSNNRGSAAATRGAGQEHGRSVGKTAAAAAGLGGWWIYAAIRGTGWWRGSGLGWLEPAVCVFWPVGLTACRTRRMCGVHASAAAHMVAAQGGSAGGRRARPHMCLCVYGMPAVATPTCQRFLAAAASLCGFGCQRKRGALCVCAHTTVMYIRPRQQRAASIHVESGGALPAQRTRSARTQHHQSIFFFAAVVGTHCTQPDQRSRRSRRRRRPAASTRRSCPAQLVGECAAGRPVLLGECPSVRERSGREAGLAREVWGREGGLLRI